MDFLSNGFHQLYSELELDDELCSPNYYDIGLQSNPIVSTISMTTSDYDTGTISGFSSSSSLSSLSSSPSVSSNFTDNINNGDSFEFERIMLTNDYGKTFEPFQSDFDYSLDDYFMYTRTGTSTITGDRYCFGIDDDLWENALLENFVEIPELIDFLPEKTPLCSDSCNSFLKESSDNLNKFSPQQATAASMVTSIKTTESAIYNDRDCIVNYNEFFMDNIEIKERLLPPTVSQSSLSSPSGYSTPLLQYQQEQQIKSQSSHHHNLTSECDDDDEKVTFPCTFGNCTKIYAKPAHLKAHLRRHLGDKPYVCTWPNCTWKFSRSDELARHKRSHSGIKPYKCIYCSKCFARSDHLSKHRKVHERKMAANKLKGIFLPTSATVVRPGRRPKNMTT